MRVYVGGQGFEEERRVRILVNEEVQDQDHPDRKLKVSS